MKTELELIAEAYIGMYQIDEAANKDKLHANVKSFLNVTKGLASKYTYHGDGSATMHVRPTNTVGSEELVNAIHKGGDFIHGITDSLNKRYEGEPSDTNKHKVKLVTTPSTYTTSDRPPKDGVGHDVHVSPLTK
jgi:hypothetical protein